MKHFILLAWAFLSTLVVSAQSPKIVSLKTTKNYFQLAQGDSFQFQVSYDKPLTNEIITATLYDVIGDTITRAYIPYRKLEHLSKNSYAATIALPISVKTGVYLVHVQTSGIDQSSGTCKVVLEIQKTPQRWKVSARETKATL